VERIAAGRHVLGRLEMQSSARAAPAWCTPQSNAFKGCSGRFSMLQIRVTRLTLGLKRRAQRDYSREAPKRSPVSVSESPSPAWTGGQALSRAAWAASTAPGLAHSFRLAK
jgi:hypothetical protein